MLCASCYESLDESATTCSFCRRPAKLDGRYALQTMLGRGAQGITFEARRVRDGKRVAIKELLVHRLDTFKGMELFEREAHALELLDHPGVPDYIEDFHVVDGRNTGLYLVQEFIEGEALSLRAMPEAEVRAIIEAIATVLIYLHNLPSPVVHRDIKPSNIMRRRRGGYVLIDFGAVRLGLNEGDPGSTIVGTMGYLAPEQLMGEATTASDIYGLGATVASLLTGRDPDALIDLQGRLDPRITEHELGPLIAEMLAHDPRARPTADEVLARLRREARALAPSAETALAGPAPRKHKKLTAGIVITLGALAVGWLFASGPLGAVAFLVGLVVWLFVWPNRNGPSLVPEASPQVEPARLSRDALAEIEPAPRATPPRSRKRQRRARAKGGRRHQHSTSQRKRRRKKKSKRKRKKKK